MTVKETIRLTLPSASYGITVGSGLLSHADEFFNLKRKVRFIGIIGGR